MTIEVKCAACGSSTFYCIHAYLRDLEAERDRYRAALESIVNFCPPEDLRTGAEQEAVLSAEEALGPLRRAGPLHGHLDSSGKCSLPGCHCT